MILIKDLIVAYNNNIILNGINLEIPWGGITVILGKNGSGKTVLLKTIAGLVDDYKGTIEIEKKGIREFYEDRFNPRRPGSNMIAYVFQRGGLFDSMNVFNNVAFGLMRKEEDEASINEIVMESLQRVGLSGSEKKLPSELSGGMQKRVGLARAICMKPEIIIYDDPTAGLDPVLSDAIADLLIEISEVYNNTSIVTAHDLKVVEKIAGTVVLLYDGQVVFKGTGDEFFNMDNPYTRQFIQGDINGPINIF